MLKRILVRPTRCLALLLIAVFAACGASPRATTTSSTGTVVSTALATSAPVLTDLRSPDDLRTSFNHDAGVPRIILLLSPT
jgi:hypothetical protein